MKTEHTLKLVLGLLTLTALVSCKEDKKDEVAPSQSATIQSNVVRNLPADTLGVNSATTGRYTFFSFKNNAIVPHSDSATSGWDIGFNSTTIIVNGGTSGPGSAAVLVWTGIYSDLSEAPADGYKQDDKNATPPNAIPTGSGKGWYNYNDITHVISPIPGRVLVFKTTDGKYVKMELISYYKDAPANPVGTEPYRFYTFRYAYQEDGSRTLK